MCDVEHGVYWKWSGLDFSNENPHSQNSASLLYTCECCQLQTGTCQEHCQRLNKKGACHLPLGRLNPRVLQLSSLPWGSSGCIEALCSRESGGTDLQRIRYFQELISWSQSLHLFISRKALNPFMVTSAPCDQMKNFCKISAWLSWAPPSPKSYILIPPLPFWSSFSELPEVLSPRLQSFLILPQIKLNLQLSCWALFQYGGFDMGVSVSVREVKGYDLGYCL